MWITVAAINHPRLCPVAAYKHLLQLVPAKGTDPAFMYYNSRGCVVPITQGVFIQALKALVTAIGQDATQYASHSLRRGGATFEIFVR